MNDNNVRLDGDSLFYNNTEIKLDAPVKESIDNLFQDTIKAIDDKKLAYSIINEGIEQGYINNNNMIESSNESAQWKLQQILDMKIDAGLPVSLEFNGDESSDSGSKLGFEELGFEDAKTRLENATKEAINKFFNKTPKTDVNKSFEISKNNYDDFSKSVKENGYTIAGLEIPADADKYEIKDGKIIVTKGNDTTEYQLRHLFGGNEFIVTDANQDFNLDDLKGVLTKDLTIKTEDIGDVRDYVIENLLEYFDKDVLKISKNIIDEFPSLNEVTTEKLTLMSYGVDYLIEIYDSYQKTIISHICEITSLLKDAIVKNEQANERGSSAKPSGGGDIKFDDPKEYPSDSDNSSTITTPIEEVVAIDQETLTRLMPSVTGMVTFASIVSMYEKIGNNLPINSSETGQYGLIGVVQENGKYYYKLLDTKTGKVYFTEITEKSKIAWDNKGERKVVEVKNENAMILKTPGESEDGLVRFAEKGDVYLLTGDEVNVDGIDYYNIMDSKTDTNNYIVSSDSVSSPKTISDLISSVDDSEVIK